MADRFSGSLPLLLIIKYNTLALTPSFSVSQPVGENSVLTILDTSTGSDSDITGRRVYLRKSDGTFLVPTGTTTDYILWDYADTSIDIDCLDKDYALLITVQWLQDSTILYAYSLLTGLTAHNEDFDYGLTTVLASNPLLINDNSFRANKFDLRTFIDAGNQAIEVGSDIKSAQLCYNQATSIRISSQYYFNESTGT